MEPEIEKIDRLADWTVIIFLLWQFGPKIIDFLMYGG